VPPYLPAARRGYYTSLNWRLVASAVPWSLHAGRTRPFPWACRVEWVDVGASTWVDSAGAVLAEADLPRLLFSTAGHLAAAGAGRTLLATAGEELVVGSPYFVAHPTVPLDTWVAGDLLGHRFGAR